MLQMKQSLDRLLQFDSAHLHDAHRYHADVPDDPEAMAKGIRLCLAGAVSDVSLCFGGAGMGRVIEQSCETG